MTLTRIAITSHNGRARLEVEDGPWSPRLVTTATASAEVALVATRALLLADDHVALQVEVGDGVRLRLTDVAATVAYNARGGRSSWTCDITVGRDASLIWDALPFVLCDGADVTRATRVLLAPGGAICLRDTTILGRQDEQAGRMRTSTHIADADGTVLAESLDIGQGHNLPGLLGQHRVIDQVILAGRRPPPPTADWPVFDLEATGAIARRLGAQHHAADVAPIMEAWSAALV